jgi:TfoX/Sxy family transcriptional regulator of competence genes
MAYDVTLAARVRALLPAGLPVREQKMFGGVAFMVQGNMCVGVTGNSLMVRVGAEEQTAALAQPHTRPMDFTGRPMRGFIYVDSPGLEKDTDLQAWVERGVDFALSLPAK